MFSGTPFVFVLIVKATMENIIAQVRIRSVRNVLAEIYQPTLWSSKFLPEMRTQYLYAAACNKPGTAITVNCQCCLNYNTEICRIRFFANCRVQSALHREYVLCIFFFFFSKITWLICLKKFEFMRPWHFNLCCNDTANITLCYMFSNLSASIVGKVQKCKTWNACMFVY